MASFQPDLAIRDFGVLKVAGGSFSSTEAALVGECSVTS